MIRWTTAVALLTMVFAVSSVEAGPGCGGCATPCDGQVTMPKSAKLVTLTGDTLDLVEELKTGPKALFTFTPDSAGKLVAAAMQEAWSGDTTVSVLGVVCGSRKQAVAAQEELKLGFPLVLDEGCAGSMALGLAYCPGATFVNRAGRVIGRAYVFSDEVLTLGFSAVRRSVGEVDPVCKMTVTPDSAAASYAYQGKTYYFCNPGCKTAFAKNPAKYLAN